MIPEAGAPGDPHVKPRHLSVRRTRATIAAVAFLLTMGLTRTITSFLHYKESDSSGGFVVHGVHIHHLIFGIVGLLATGYSWLLLVGGGREAGRWAGRITSAAYGVSAALILDEFALLLNLRDVYWERQGRESVEAFSAFGALLALTVLVSPVIRVLLRTLNDRRRTRRSDRAARRSGAPPPPPH